MSLAVNLLIVVAIASVIGTLLRQNEPYSAYLSKFGPYWFDYFNLLGLYQLYTTPWFLLLLAFLLISTSVCLYRNTPSMIRQAFHWQGARLTRADVLQYPNAQRWQIASSSDAVITHCKQRLTRAAYRCKVADTREPGAQMITARRGTIKRLGYIFTHLAIVVLILGGVLDSPLGLKVAQWMGNISIETRDIPASQVPQKSYLPLWNPTFRADVLIPEGQSTRVAFVRLDDGYLVQPLPFEIELVDFRVEHYSTGQPKAFVSDLLVHDPTEPEVIRASIAVNHPLQHRGYTIYQSSFSDGGSSLQASLLPLDGSDASDQISSKVYEQYPLSAPWSGRLEFEDFRLFNIEALGDIPGEEELTNVGPSVRFKLRAPDGRAHEYHNYMLPIARDGARFLISGVRASVQDDWQYLQIPVDAENSVQRFIKFVQAAHNSAYIDEIIRQDLVPDMIEQDLVQEQGIAPVVTAISGLVTHFLSGGFDAIYDSTPKTLAEDARKKRSLVYVGMLQSVLSQVYQKLLLAEGTALDPTNPIDWVWFENALIALDSLTQYASPFYLQLQHFEHLEASGLQIARLPGTYLIYLGSILLILGVFMMFYIRVQQVWVWVGPAQESTIEIILAGNVDQNALNFVADSRYTRLL